MLVTVDRVFGFVETVEMLEWKEETLLLRKREII